MVKIEYRESASQKRNVIQGYRRRKTGTHAWLIASLLIASDCATLFGFVSVVMKFIALSYFVLRSIFGQSKRRLRRLSLLLAIVGFTILVFETPFQSGNFSKVSSIGLYFLILNASLFAGRLIVDDEELFRCVIVCTILVCSLMIVSLPMIREQLAFRVGLDDRIRIKGCFSNENSLGHICAMLGVLSVSAVIRLGGQSKVIFAWICCGINLILCIASGSRTALIIFIAFIIICLYHNMRKKCGKQTYRVVLDIITSVVTIIILYIVIPLAIESFNESLRVGVINNFTAALWGVGYASSKQIEAITSFAGGSTEMLFISLFYRVGFIGMLAYLMIFAASFISREKYDFISFAVLVFLVLQMIGESYISSVMSFVSFFDWVILSGLHVKNQRATIV